MVYNSLTAVENVLDPTRRLPLSLSLLREAHATYVPPPSGVPRRSGVALFGNPATTMTRVAALLGVTHRGARLQVRSATVSR